MKGTVTEMRMAMKSICVTAPTVFVNSSTNLNSGSYHFLLHTRMIASRKAATTGDTWRDPYIIGTLLPIRQSVLNLLRSKDINDSASKQNLRGFFQVTDKFTKILMIWNAATAIPRQIVNNLIAFVWVANFLFARKARATKTKQARTTTAKRIKVACAELHSMHFDSESKWKFSKHLPHATSAGSRLSAQVPISPLGQAALCRHLQMSKLMEPSYSSSEALRSLREVLNVTK
mmetsp:Transcript_25780/g.54724  ORF Transcript_25780/g.54724 Transcript_25780/m.54724 type:complete len:232 (-) Transcript_25780:73-768(-)